MTNTKQKTAIIRNYVIVCGWALVIFTLSHQPAAVSSGQSGVIVGHLQQAMPGVSTAVLTFLVRKSAHIIAYFILGILMYRALRISIRRWRARTVASLALLSCTGGSGVMRVDDALAISAQEHCHERWMTA